jgi:hypothetical protein
MEILLLAVEGLVILSIPYLHFIVVAVLRGGVLGTATSQDIYTVAATIPFRFITNFEVTHT